MSLYLYHYYERDFGPFSPLTALPFDAAKKVLLEQKATGKFRNPDIDGFLQKRYERDKKLYNLFIAHGGKPVRTAPIYMMLGEHKQWESAYENPAVIKIPLEEFDPLTVSFTYGDSFAVLNPALYGKEEFWGKIYFSDEILQIIERFGMPPYVEYDFKRGIYPKDKNINHYLKYVEAHVWSDDAINKYKPASLFFCGHDCSRCLTYLATVNNDEELRVKSQRFYKDKFNLDIPLEKLRCLGGRSEGVFYMCNGCPWMKCAKEKGLSACSECVEYPCKPLAEYQEKYVNKRNQI